MTKHLSDTRTSRPPAQGLLVAGQSVPLRESSGLVDDTQAELLDKQTTKRLDGLGQNVIQDWQDYHTAWQRYYQQFYHHHYANQLQMHREQASRTDVAISNVLGQTQPKSEKRREVTQLQQALHSAVANRAKIFRRSHHFVPLLSALAVGLVFLFLQYNRAVFAGVNAYISPGSTVNASDVVLVDPAANLDVGQEPKLIIPKINVNTKVLYDITSVAENKIQAGLRDGVVHYNLPGANALPGQVGNTVLLGHSSNDIFDPGSSKFVFVLLERLQAGDIFYVHYQGTRYVYRVSERKVIKPTEINTLQLSNGKPTVTLVTCTPLGTDLNRLLVIGEQISPDPAAAKHVDTAKADEKPGAIPGGSPSLLEQLWHFFTP